MFGNEKINPCAPIGAPPLTGNGVSREADVSLLPVLENPSRGKTKDDLKSKREMHTTV